MKSGFGSRVLGGYEATFVRGAVLGSRKALFALLYSPEPLMGTDRGERLVWAMNSFARI